MGVIPLPFLKRARARRPFVGLFLALCYIVRRCFSADFIKQLLAEALTDDLHEPRAEVGVSDACQGQGTLTKRQATETHHAVFGGDVVDLIAPLGHGGPRWQDWDNARASAILCRRGEG